jgi:hypothetical protein
MDGQQTNQTSFTPKDWLNFRAWVDAQGDNVLDDIGEFLGWAECLLVDEIENGKHRLSDLPTEMLDAFIRHIGSISWDEAAKTFFHFFERGGDDEKSFQIWKAHIDRIIRDMAAAGLYYSGPAMLECLLQGARVPDPALLELFSSGSPASAPAGPAA